MSDFGRTERLFDERESAAILKRTAELEMSEDRSALPGLSLDALKEIAESAGMDPALVEVAASELDSGVAEGGRFWSLGPTTLSRERVVKGEVESESWEEIAAEIRQAHPDVGTAQLVGNSLEWTARDDGSSEQVTIRAQDGEVRIRAFSDFSRKVAPLWALRIAPALLFGIIGVGASSFLGLFGAVAWLGLSFALTRKLCAEMFRRRDDRIAALLDALDERITGLAAVEHPSTKQATRQSPVSRAGTARDPRPGRRTLRQRVT